MKKLNTFCMLFFMGLFLMSNTTSKLSCNSHFSSVIGTASGSTYTVTGNKATLKLQLETFMGYSMVIDTTKFQILYDSASAEYLLIGKNSAETKTVAVALELSSGSFYEQVVNGGGQSVTCASTCCQKGCNPRGVGTENPWCSDCTTPNCSLCGKTVTTSGNQIFNY